MGLGPARGDEPSSGVLELAGCISYVGKDAGTRDEMQETRRSPCLPCQSTSRGFEGNSHGSTLQRPRGSCRPGIGVRGGAVPGPKYQESDGVMGGAAKELPRESPLAIIWRGFNPSLPCGVAPEVKQVD